MSLDTATTNALRVEILENAAAAYPEAVRWQKQHLGRTDITAADVFDIKTKVMPTVSTWVMLVDKRVGDPWLIVATGHDHSIKEALRALVQTSRAIAGKKAKKTTHVAAETPLPVPAAIPEQHEQKQATEDGDEALQMGKQVENEPRTQQPAGRNDSHFEGPPTQPLLATSNDQSPSIYTEKREQARLKIRGQLAQSAEKTDQLEETAMQPTEDASSHTWPYRSDSLAAESPQNKEKISKTNISSPMPLSTPMPSSWPEPTEITAEVKDIEPSSPSPAPSKGLLSKLSLSNLRKAKSGITSPNIPKLKSKISKADISEPMTPLVEDQHSLGQGDQQTAQPGRVVRREVSRARLDGALPAPPKDEQ